MADTPPTGETVIPGDTQTNATPPAAPVANADTAEVERLRKEADQSRMRASQAQNELDKIKSDQAEAERKRLEEKDEYKQLYEKTEAELKQIRDTQTAAEEKAKLDSATDTLFKEYPAEVVELAKTAGLGLSDDSEAATAALKEKLDAFKAKVAPNAPNVGSSNPAPEAPAPTGQTGGLGRPKSLGVDTGQVTISPEANKEKIGEYIRSIPAIEQMKQDAGLRPRT